jgi:hypothetical protein
LPWCALNEHNRLTGAEMLQAEPYQAQEEFEGISR